MWPRKRRERIDPRPYDERMEEAQVALVESENALVQAEQVALRTAQIAQKLRHELHDNHFAPALAEAIARSLR